MDINFTQFTHRFNCNDCRFTANNKHDYNRHLLTAKHTKIQKGYKKDIILLTNTPPAEGNKCQCGKSYMHHSGLWRHQTKCTFIKSCESTANDAAQPNVNIIFELLKQNQEFKDIIIEQNEKMIELSKQTQEQQLEQNEKMIELSKQTQEQQLEQNKNIIELAAKVGCTTNIKTQNNLFNLNIFLNETCKDAVDINEFIQDLPVSFQQLENIGRKGYVAGITDVILTQLKTMDITKRPLHCTDLKRDTMYIKNTNEWVKDDNDNTMMTQIFRRIAKNNLKQINKWSQENPISQVSDSKENIFCMNVMLNSLGAYGDAQLKLDNKVLKSIAKEVHVDRNI